LLHLLDNKKINLVLSDSYRHQFDALIANTETLNLLKTIPNESVELVVSSPPYNLGKSYENRQEFKAYLGVQKQVIEECYRILKPEGNFCEAAFCSAKKEILSVIAFLSAAASIAACFFCFSYSTLK